MTTATPRIDCGPALSEAGPQMTQAQFERLRKIVCDASGIVLQPEKRAAVESRLQRRLKSLSLDTFSRYLDLVRSAGHERELIALINAVTINKTDFFREPVHFRFLAGQALPDLAALGAGAARPLNAWSAACSTGEEPHTLAIALAEYGAGRRGPFGYTVLGTDISTEVLRKAATGIYRTSDLSPVTPALVQKYFLRSRKPGADAVRVAPEIRKTVRFERLDLVHGAFGSIEPMDVIFCRNVLIYFDRPTQELVVQRLARKLQIGGFLFMGHSEALSGMDLPLRAVAPTIYRRVR